MAQRFAAAGSEGLAASQGCLRAPGGSCSSDSVPLGGGEECISEHRMDFHFRCNWCIQFIAQDRPVYMLNDLSYCSATCRRRGRSKLYSNLKSLQLDRLRDMRKIPSDSATSMIS